MFFFSSWECQNRTPTSELVLVAVMQAFEPVLQHHKPSLVLVYGDVNSTLAAALVCSKLGVRIGHVEAGLRSRDRSMPEEINRLLTDQLSDLLFTPSADGDENLLSEGIDPAKIHRVGNVMIDSLVRILPSTDKYFPADLTEPYALVTLHRPSNVDDLDWLNGLLEVLLNISLHLTVIFPVHPRTRERVNQLGFFNNTKSHLRLIDPMPYLQFIALQRRASVVITDSGGIQEETTFLGVPCLTVRENTERPVTVTLGTNQLVGRDVEKLNCAVQEIMGRTPVGLGPKQDPIRVPLWDGHAAERIAQIIVQRGATGIKI